MSIGINELPAGLLHAVFDFLPPKDLCSVSATCKLWRRLNQDAAADEVPSLHCTLLASLLTHAATTTVHASPQTALHPSSPLLAQAWEAFFGQRWMVCDLGAPPASPKARDSDDPAEEEQESTGAAVPGGLTLARPAGGGECQTWQARYGRKMRTQRAFGGRSRQDSFFGHRGGVRCLGLLPACNLMATGGMST